MANACIEKNERDSRDTAAVYDTPEFLSEVESYRLALRGPLLTTILTFAAGTGFTLFGYDQGVMSSLLTAKQFERVFPQIIVDDSHRKHATLQSLLVAIYEVGCLVGALSNLWIGDKLGRRRTIVLGGVVMMVGAILQATSYSYAQILVARVVAGLGNGLNTSTVPAYHAECSPPSRHGSLIMIEGSLITFGIMISYVSSPCNSSLRKAKVRYLRKWIDFAFFWAKNSSAQWRAPIALQIVFALVMIIAVKFLPESPRWLIKSNRPAEAMAVISALEDKAPSDTRVRMTFQAMLEAVALDELGHNRKPPKNGGRSQNFRRVMLGVIIQCFQQITGINLITYYATLLFERLGIRDVLARIIAACNATEYFIASLIAIFLIDRVGRRKLMLFAAAGQCLTMVLLAVLGKVNTVGARVTSAVLLFVFNSIFAIGWLGMTWLYPAEIVGLRIRGPANALSTASNWIWNFFVVMITGPSFAHIGWRTYIVFASLNAFIIPIVYLFFPETAGRSLEGGNADMDVIFAVAYEEGISPVTVSFRKDLPKAGSLEAKKILGLSTELTNQPTTPSEATRNLVSQRQP